MMVLVSIVMLSVVCVSCGLFFDVCGENFVDIVLMDSSCVVGVILEKLLLLGWLVMILVIRVLCLL